MVEEMAELLKEICKNWHGRENLEAIADEMADVGIMLDQMSIVFQNDKLVKQRRAYKVDRLRQRLCLKMRGTPDYPAYLAQYECVPVPIKEEP